MARDVNATLQSHVEQFSRGVFSEITSTQIIFGVLTVLVSCLILEQVVYRAKKGGLPGSKWTIPIIGKFAETVGLSVWPVCLISSL